MLSFPLLDQSIDPTAKWVAIILVMITILYAAFRPLMRLASRWLTGCIHWLSGVTALLPEAPN